ncbi:dual specificity calcium/calmodulin-dependent 3',5'-cyclic nucleotide phosphodiesterase 1C-like [Gasterosteus aculeatus]
MLRRNEDKPRFRSIVHAVQAGIFVERMYRRTSNIVGLSYPQDVITVLKHVDMWSFDVFALNDASGDHALKFVFYELFTRYDLINRFKVPVCVLISFVDSLEVGYSKHKNPYHNLTHAADVTQTIHYLLLKTGMVVRSGLGKSTMQYAFQKCLQTSSVDLTGHSSQLSYLKIQSGRDE